MNVHRNRCMNRTRNIVSAIALMCLAPQISAQTYDIIERRNPWNAGTNAAGIRMDSVTISYAELYGRYTGGGFRNYYEADRTWSAGAVAKTIAHTRKYSMKGSFSFDQTEGSDMCGSMFIRPGYYPVDVLEFTPGRKVLQTYGFTGGISGDIARNWRVGAEMDFTSANYAKRKDLRHSNYRLDMQVAPGIMFHSGKFAVGANYIYGRNTETIKAEKLGAADLSYDAFLDKGLMYGTAGGWDSDGIHLSTTGISGFPVKEIFHGGALQLQYGDFYADAEYRHGKGSAGEKDTYWFDFPSHRISSHLAYRFDRGAVQHFVRVRIDWSYQTNDENVIQVIKENGIDITHTYGSNHIFERTSLEINPEYELTAPKGEIIAGMALSSDKDLALLMYPYVFTQPTICGRAYAKGTLHAGRFDIKAGLAFASGKYDKKITTVPIGNGYGDPPYFLEEYYNMKYEYMTATRVSASAALRWNFYRGMYAEAGGEYTRGFNLKYIKGADRYVCTLKIGYTF